MKRFLIILVLCALLPLSAAPARSQPAAHVDDALQARLEQVVSGFRGDAGVYVRHLPTGRTAAVQADSLFPTASLVKVPILIKIFDLIDRGELTYHQPLIYRDSLRRSDYDLLAAFRDSSSIELAMVVMLMETMSDNTGSLWLQHLAGTGTAVNEWLAAHGFDHTRVNSRTQGREAAYEAYGWGQTTPREMAELLVMIREGRAVSPAASEEMYRVLTRSYWNDDALSELPPYVQAASKQGALNHYRSEVVLVNAPHGDYVFTVIADDLQDTRWVPENEGSVFIRDVARTLWNYFEPDAGWAPPAPPRY